MSPRLPSPPYHGSVAELDSPALLIEEAILDSNIQKMQQLADRSGVALRPHIKTHKSVALARRQIKAGAVGIAVAKLSEAEIFSDAGFTDIQISNQIVGEQKIERLAALAERITISSAVDSAEGIQSIAGVFAARDRVADVLIEIDSGLHRCGVSTVDDALRLAEIIETTQGVRLVGLLTHAGHAYGAASPDEVKEIGFHEGKLMGRMADSLRQRGFSVPVVSVGSTPTAAHAIAAGGITELRVGNYVFNDRIQTALGVATIYQCALSVLATVISVHPDRVVIDAGSKVLSSDSGAHGSRLVSGFGLIIGTGQVIARLSEEHGIIELSGDVRFSVGQRIRIIPNHACPVMNLATQAYVVNGERVVELISVDARAMVQ